MKSTLIPTFLFLLCLLGCEKMADIGSPQEYDTDGVSFSYPGNWSIGVEKLGQGEDKTKVINLESPGDAIVIMCLYDFEEDGTLWEFAEDFISDMDLQEIPLVKQGKSDFSPITRQGKSQPIKGLKNRLKFSFLGESIPHVQEYFVFKKGGRSLYVVCQSAEEDLEKTEPAFRQIVGSIELE